MQSKPTTAMWSPRRCLPSLLWQRMPSAQPAPVPAVKTWKAISSVWKTLEALCNGFEGVESSYAVQAGREVRILVQPDKVGDDQVILLARQVAKKIEDELDYPGQIKVSVIRESRATEYAK